jgi:hypothetical protein
MAAAIPQLRRPEHLSRAALHSVDSPRLSLAPALRAISVSKGLEQNPFLCRSTRPMPGKWGEI